MFTNAQWRDADETEIIAVRGDGVTMVVPVDDANSDYRLITQGDTASP